VVSYKKLILIPLCVNGLFVIQGCRKETKEIEVPQKETKPTPIERLLSKDGQEIYAARNELLAAKKDLIAKLIDIIKEKENLLNNQPSVRAAIFILGEMRAVEAIDVLVDQIGFPRIYEGEAGIVGLEGGTMFHRGLKNIGKVYPAAGALIKIGEPCLDAVVTKLASTVGIFEPKACLGVLVGLRGRDSTAEMLKAAIERETDAKKKERLESSLDMLAKMPD